uniref:Uncharacterized protein n=1 Tax=Oryza sativa subsp. japonica TaxID=39947 RepID=Q69LC9_ORYSJ|nr:hypothetical protein [Oryza sativa Japonica Group]BAD31794.1 hypothetical protein [Oryza sativa Japonica Group]
MCGGRWAAAVWGPWFDGPGCVETKKWAAPNRMFVQKAKEKVHQRSLVLSAELQNRP